MASLAFCEAVPLLAYFRGCVAAGTRKSQKMDLVGLLPSLLASAGLAQVMFCVGFLTGCQHPSDTRIVGSRDALLADVRGCVARPFRNGLKRLENAQKRSGET